LNCAPEVHGSARGADGRNAIVETTTPELPNNGGFGTNTKSKSPSPSPTSTTRRVHRAEVLSLTGDSYRTRARRELLAKDPTTN
jgi:hypothetical protein